jgi:mono/diheme cytochrome c family protein
MRGVVLAVVASVSLALAAGGLTRSAPRSVAATPPAGWSLYDRYCLACHGSAGDGRGPAAPFSSGKPRDFTSGAYEWRSTAVGEPPTDDDLRAAIRFGVTGTSMPAFDGIFSDIERDQLIAILKSFSPQTFAKRGKPITLGPPPAATNATRGAALWTQHGCDKCHGATGRGDTQAAPYDLTTQPFRRPRAPDADKRRAIAMSIATGMTGTPMPGYAGTLPDADLWALADHVLALNAKATVPRDHTVLDAETIAADAKYRLELGTWPGSDPDEARVFGAPIAAQGTPPASLTPAQASLSERQCARCHAKQAREWTTSVHASATAWGLGARELDHAVEEGSSCNRCHAPLAEQQPGATGFDSALRSEGVTCAGCHVRDWERRGPPRRAPSLLPASSYPLVELAIYERSDFCLACHQLPPRTAINGKPLLNTYKEWLEGPYMARGIQCQHCHMPNREHTWLGVHDRDTVRQGIKLAATAQRASTGVVSVTAKLTNVGAGHYLPTTVTPALVLRIELLDAKGIAISGARAEHRIARTVRYTTRWQEDSDTRIPPGETAAITRGWKKGRTPQATTARITIEVHPDAYYEGLYAERLKTKLPAATRSAYETALARASSSHYVAEQLDVDVATP